ncbi:hypothetical protein RvVAR031_35800 [Agrobacterium vitis]|uniref:hypothetical protein n=1 Tax=Agrobacterium vitis TaxID=373 RepID=UPI0015DACD9D|nr:hypothetical protein [Agrobacterium vitis]BCH55970.1 hypothetical protein RvVAR031_35800 [Agrobacterium vitis]
MAYDKASLFPANCSTVLHMEAELEAARNRERRTAMADAFHAMAYREMPADLRERGNETSNDVIGMLERKIESAKQKNAKSFLLVIEDCNGKLTSSASIAKSSNIRDVVDLVHSHLIDPPGQI